MSVIRLAVTLRGAVQGVGFRPWLYRRARAFGLGGWAANSATGLALELEGDDADVAGLLAELRHNPPAQARIASVETNAAAPQGERSFVIRASVVDGAVGAEVPVDFATCGRCLSELRDAADRRHRYPFITCTACGPRYTIVERLPYDRQATAMRRFAMCCACRAEYEDPDDRRFHAEAIACPDCGPRLAFHGRGVVAQTGDAALVAAVEALRAGAVVAVKGVGGYHLVVDAGNEDAVQQLRARKGRSEKPFAVMFPDLESVRTACRVGVREADLLSSPEAPIVLLERAGDRLAPGVAPDNPLLGVLLPYTPVHHLILDALGAPVVATSGNRGGDPIVYDDADASVRLEGLADFILGHDRPILRAVDDSIVRVIAGRDVVLRRARGLAPTTFPIDGGSCGGLVALGGHLKVTCAITRPSGVVLSQHLGDLDSPLTRVAHGRAIADLARLHGVEPRQRVGDLHPDYASGGRDRAVQHHLAHVVACVTDAGAALPVLGVAFDGGGDGGDGTIWGGEFLCVEARAWRRVASLRPFPLPGGEAAVREPRRSALGLLYTAFGVRAFERTDLAPIGAFTAQERGVLARMLARGVNAPLTSSVGRLFDAFAALAGIRQTTTYEGQAAAALEWAAGRAPSERPYPFELLWEVPACAWPSARRRGIAGGSPLPHGQIDWQPALDAALADLAAGAGAGAIARAFHDGLVATIVAVAERVGLARVALTGGCFQNARLTASAAAALGAAGFEPVLHRRVPPNDGGLALGQAVWAARRQAREATGPCA